MAKKKPRKKRTPEDPPSRLPHPLCALGKEFSKSHWMYMSPSDIDEIILFSSRNDRAMWLLLSAIVYELRKITAALSHSKSQNPVAKTPK